MVLVNGAPERHPESAYYLEWREGSKRKRLSVGQDPADAAARRLRKEAELNAKNNGIAVTAPESTNGRRPLGAAIADYLEEIKLGRKDKTYVAYDLSLRYFAESCSKIFVDEIERKDLLKFAAFLRDEKQQAPRTCWNKFANIMSFLKAQGVRGLVGKNDWPRFVEEEPDIYEKEELDALFTACSTDDLLWFQFFLMTGMREQEVMYAYWSDVNFKANILRVTHKPDRGWTPKTYKEREIPIPKKLVEELKGWKAKCDKECPLVFRRQAVSQSWTFWTA